MSPISEPLSLKPQQATVSSDLAAQLWAKLAATERKLPAGGLAWFSAFVH